jgi:hypothetical protein
VSKLASRLALSCDAVHGACVSDAVLTLLQPYFSSSRALAGQESRSQQCNQANRSKRMQMNGTLIDGQ